MRTAISTAAPPRHLHWQAALTLKAYQTLSPVVWHHAFVSDAHMTNWRGGSGRILRWSLDGSRDGKADIPSVTLGRSFRHLTILNVEGIASGEGLSP